MSYFGNAIADMAYPSFKGAFAMPYHTLHALSFDAANIRIASTFGSIALWALYVLVLTFRFRQMARGQALTSTHSNHLTTIQLLSLSLNASRGPLLSSCIGMTMLCGGSALATWNGFLTPALGIFTAIVGTMVLLGSLKLFADRTKPAMHETPAIDQEPEINSVQDLWQLPFSQGAAEAESSDWFDRPLSEEATSQIGRFGENRPRIAGNLPSVRENLSVREALLTALDFIESDPKTSIHILKALRGSIAAETAVYWVLVASANQMLHGNVDVTGTRVRNHLQRAYVYCERPPTWLQVALSRHTDQFESLWHLEVVRGFVLGSLSPRQDQARD